MRCNPSYWLLGLIPIALLSWVAVQVEHESIEADLGRRTQESLARSGLNWPVPIFFGRDSVLTGKASDDNEPGRALAKVRDTWGVRVVQSRTEMLQSIDKYLWSANWRDGKLVLNGYVPNEDSRKLIVSAAGTTFPKAEIKDDMKLARGAPDRDQWHSGINFALKQLSQLKKGEAEIEVLDLTIAGEAPTSPIYKSVKTTLATAMPSGVKLAAEKITPPIANPFVWGAKSAGNQLLMSGFVPTEKLREQLFNEAKGLFPKLALVDRTDVADGAPDGWSKAAQAALAQLAQLKTGTADIKNREMVFTGEATDEATAQAVQKALRLGVPQAFKLTEQIKFPKPQVQAPSNYVMSITADGTAIEVSGYVPSEAARTALIETVKARFPGRPVTDKLQVVAGAPEGWQTCIVAGLASLPRLKSGKALLNDMKLLVSGTTDDYSVAQGVPADVKAAAGQACSTATEIAFTGQINSNLSWRAAHGEQGDLTLAGDIPDEASRSVLMEAAQRLFPKARPVDQMKVVAAPMEPWNAVAVRGLEQLARLQRGEASLVKQDLTVRGFADNAKVAADIKAALSTGLPQGFSGQDQIEVARKIEIISEADTCQELLREAASKGIIQFERAKADLTADSTDTLYGLAEIANACPAFRIEIEGHTDAEGTDERNQRLSDRRAQEVVRFLSRAGVDASRLRAVGYGATRPIADNNTADGRAKNRRIEFTVKGS